LALLIDKAASIKNEMLTDSKASLQNDAKSNEVE